MGTAPYYPELDRYADVPDHSGPGFLLCKLRSISAAQAKVRLRRPLLEGFADGEDDGLAFVRVAVIIQFIG